MADKYKQKKIEYIFMAVVFLGYLAFNGILLLGHEQWRDEANVWLMARELSPLSLFGEIKYQGHPCLWYLLMMPFAKAGLPFETISFVSYTIMAVTAGLFLWKAPFYGPIKAAVLFSPAFTYYYAVVARNYCLIALFLILLAVYYPKRNEKSFLFGLLLGLLVQSDVIALMTAGAISIIWSGENLWQSLKQRSAVPFINILKGIWLPLCSLVLLIMQFYHVSDSPVFQVNSFGKGELLRETRNYSFQILERLSGWEESFCLLFFFLFLLLTLFVSLKLRNIQAVAVMAAAYLFQAFFSAMVYQLHIWHFLSLCFVFIWMLWTMYGQCAEKRVEDKGIRAALAGLQMLLLVLSASMFLRWNAENETSSLDNALHGMYSDGAGTAGYIRENISSEELIVSVNVPRASTVLAYLPEYEFYFAGNGQKESYANWSEEQNLEIGFEELLLWVKTNFPEKREFFILDSSDSCLTDKENRLEECEVLYRTLQETARGEEYTVYHVEIGR